jgi:hypothetical protein
MTHNTTWKKVNVVPSKTDSSEYGAFWVGVDNDTYKSTGIFETILDNRAFKYYSKFIKTYNNLDDFNNGVIASLSYETGSVAYQSPKNISTGIQNHRYNGCKLTDPDINNPSEIPQIPGGGAVVEVIVNCSSRQECTVDCPEYCDEE